jgi:7-cyano-7-deazaguanine synthase
MTTKAVVLLSGGVDSSVAAFWASKERKWEVHALSINYGHKAQAELDSSHKIATLIAETHTVLSLNDLGLVFTSPLVNQAIKQTENSRKGDSYYVVPLRNIVFLSIAAAFAESIGAYNVVIGNHLDDAEGFPDCRVEAIDAMQKVVNVASEKEKAPLLWSPWLARTKVDIIRIGQRLGVPFKYTYSCYEDGGACGVCESCEKRFNAFLKAGIKDPIKYKKIPRIFK